MLFSIIINDSATLISRLLLTYLLAYLFTIKIAEQQTIIQHYGDWYIGR